VHPLDAFCLRLSLHAVGASSVSVASSSLLLFRRRLMKWTVRINKTACQLTLASAWSLSLHLIPLRRPVQPLRSPPCPRWRRCTRTVHQPRRAGGGQSSTNELTTILWWACDCLPLERVMEMSLQVTPRAWPATNTHAQRYVRWSLVFTSHYWTLCTAYRPVRTAAKLTPTPTLILTSCH